MAGIPEPAGAWDARRWRGRMSKLLIAWKLGGNGFVPQVAQTEYDCPWRMTGGPVLNLRWSRTSRGDGDVQ